MPTFDTGALKTSYRQDEFTDPDEQNQRLAQLLTTIWRQKKIHIIVRIENIDPASAIRGWRIYFEG
ncbi:MAG: hypothetical protein JNM84_22840 [Planctomycetes bacterium]|nr:hypothetical protein [Planctomycetota bacterium]